MKSLDLRVDLPAGMDSRYRTAAEQAERIVDMWFDRRGVWRSMPGYGAAVSGEAAGLSVETVYWWSQHNGARRWLMFETDAGTTLTLRVYLGSGNTSLALQTRQKVGLWQRTQYMANGNWLYFINGYDEPARFNGTRLTKIGFTERPPAPTTDDPEGTFDHYDFTGTTAAGTAMGDNVTFRQRGVGRSLLREVLHSTSWQYGYAYTWVNDLSMESPLSPIVFAQGENKIRYTGGAPIVALEGRRSVYLRIPPAPPHVVGVRVYRTANLRVTQVQNRAFPVSVPSSTSNVWTELPLEEQQNVALYFHSQISSGAEVVVVDEKSDAALGAKLDPDTLGVFPTTAKYLAMFKGTMFVAGTASYPDRIFYSAPRLIEQFPEINYLPIGDRDSGEVTGMYATKNALVVFKRRGIYLVKGDPVEGFHTSTLTEDTGCTSPNAIMELPGVGLLFVAEDGVHVLVGALENTGTPTGTQRISDPIQDVWDERVDKPSLMAAQGAIYHRQKEAWIQVPADGNFRPSLGLVYHYETRQWSLREGWPINCFAESRDEYGRMYVGTHDATGLQVLGEGFASKGLATVRSSYRTSWLDFGSQYDRAAALYMQPFVLNYGSRQLALTYRKDRHLLEEHTLGQVQQMQDAEHQKDLWMTATWSGGVGRWQDYTPVSVRYDLVDGALGSAGISTLEMQLELSTGLFEGSSGRWGLVAYDVGVTPGNPSKIKKMSNLQPPETR